MSAVLQAISKCSHINNCESKVTVTVCSDILPASMNTWGTAAGRVLLMTACGDVDAGATYCDCHTDNYVI